MPIFLRGVRRRQLEGGLPQQFQPPPRLPPRPELTRTALAQEVPRRSSSSDSLLTLLNDFDEGLAPERLAPEGMAAEPPLAIPRYMLAAVHDATASPISPTTSGDTVTDRVFGHDPSQYNSSRNLMVVLLFMKTGVVVFPSHKLLRFHRYLRQHEKDPPPAAARLTQLGVGFPVFHTLVSLMLIFKRDLPYMVIHQYEPPGRSAGEGVAGAPAAGKLVDLSLPKFEYCRVYYRLLSDLTVAQVLEFDPHGYDRADPLRDRFRVLLLLSPARAHADAVFKGTRMRFLGVTSTTLMFGSRNIRMHVASDGEPILHDYAIGDLEQYMVLHGKLKLEIDRASPLIRLGPNNPFLHFMRRVRASTSQGNGAGKFGQYADATEQGLTPRSKVEGVLALRENPSEVESLATVEQQADANDRLLGTADGTDISGDAVFRDTMQLVVENETTLVVLCMFLVLRELERRKNRGERRNSFGGNGLGSGYAAVFSAS